MKRWGDWLLGDRARVPFEQRIFHFAILLAVVMTAFGTAMDVYYRANILVDFVFLGGWVLTYYFSRYKNWFHVMSVVSMVVFVFGFVPYLWLGSGGCSGVIPYYTVFFAAFICLMLKGPFRIAMISSLAAIVLLLIVRDAVEAGSFTAAVQSNVRPLDFILHLGALLAVSAVLLIVYSNTYRREKERSDAYSMVIEENYRQQLYYMENLEQLIYKLKAERHDFNNHLGVIYGLLEGGEAENARSYAMQLVKNAQDYQNIVNIPYPMARAMLNYKLSVARDSGIELRINVAVPDGLALDELDMTVILGNLLDNAMEACVALESGNGYIDLGIQYRPDYLIIQMENPLKETPAAHGGSNRTTKPDAGNHGFGLGNIGYLVSKHNGLMQIEPENGAFKVNIALLATAEARTL